ncbi:MAG: RluA family pseudouridine synthase, partial [Zoogloeaceae bacterium]|nr:RluA family pseudouridine synthase [Zoogloeaceae bacterium]
MSDHLTVPDDCAGLRLDQALARLFPSHSRSRLQSWLKAGLVTLDGGTRDAKQKVWGGEALQVCPPMAASETASLPEDIPLEIVFEDECMLVINKPADLVVHPGSGNWSGTLLNALLHHAPELAGVPRAGIVHRLDKDTTGLMVVARTLEAQTDLVRQLQARSVKRHYIAVAHGLIAADGKVDAPIGRHPVHRTRMAVVPSGRPALTHYHVRERF